MDNIDTTQDQNRFPAQPAPRSGNVGALAAAVVIVLLLAAGGFYFFWNQQEKQQTASDAQAQEAGATTAQNDSTNSIESDLNATQTSGSDTDVSSLNDAL